MTTTLLAVTGLSPAVVTETLWALAREAPSLLPERVEFITTATGAVRLEEALFTPRGEWRGHTVWDTLRRDLGAAESQLIAAPVQVIPSADGTTGRSMPLDDIRTPAENTAAAEFIFSRVWDVVRDPDRRLIASIAGGRKTMGALLHSAVSLIGREHDRITHVLVSPPYDTLPGFFFPTQPDSPLPARDGGAHDPANARVQLAEVPFVPLRNRFRELDALPGSFLGLRNELARRLSEDGGQPVPIAIDHDAGLLTVAGATYPARARALAVLHFVLECNQAGDIPLSNKDAVEPFKEWLTTHRNRLGRFGTGASVDDHDFSRELNLLRKILRSAPWSPAQRTLRQSVPFAFAGW